MRNVALALCLILPLIFRSQNRHQLDSLLRNIKNNPFKEDTTLARNFHEIASGFTRIDLDSCKIFADKALALSTKLNYKKGISSAYNALGIYHHLSGQFDDAILNYQRSKELKEQMGDKKSAISSQNNIGIVYYMQGKYDKALLTFNTSLKTQEGMKDTSGIPNTLNYIASVHYFLSNFEKALGSYLKALELYKRTNDLPGMSQAYNNLGIIYSSLNNEDKAIENYNNSLTCANKIGAKDLVTTCYNNMGAIFQKRKDYAKALQFFTKSLELSRELKLTEGIALNLEKVGQIMEVQNKPDEAMFKYQEALSILEKSGQAFNTASILQSMGGLYTKMNRSVEAVKCFERALKIANEIKAKKLIADVSFDYAMLLKNNGDYKRSYFFLKQYSAIRDSILSEEKNKSLAEMQTRFDTEAKENEIVLLNKTKDIEVLKLGEQKENIEKQKVTIYASGTGIVLALTLAFFAFRSYSEKKRTNLMLEEKNQAIYAQKEILETKNNLITNSILYAKGIQDEILPENVFFKDSFRNSFVLFKPKDVVSGDFYWLQAPLTTSNSAKGGEKYSGRGSNEEISKKDYCYLAAIDCVGHGVPGGLMALHTYNLLEKIYKESKGASPAAMLNRLNKQVIETLHQNNKDTSAKHGMDLALLKIKENTVVYAGARNPLIIVTPTKELKEIKADRMFVGGALGHFTDHEVNVEKGSMLYIFTDGYADQKGGGENTKFFNTVLKDLLASVSDKPADEQKNMLEKTFMDWKGTNEQMDDVLIIGIRI